MTSPAIASGSRRTFRLAVLVTLLAAALLVVAAATAVPARATGPSETACHTSPSNGNCNGATFSDTFDGICWTSDSYAVNERYGNTLYWTFPSPYTDWTAYTQLWYSPECKVNWAVTFLYYENCAENPVWSTKVRRYSGPDGGYIMLHAQWLTGCNPGTYGAGVAVSPMVYAPDNLAQACASFTSNDQYVCTKEF